MSTPQDEVVARARQIFERLRQASQPSSAEEQTESTEAGRLDVRPPSAEDNPVDPAAPLRTDASEPLPEFELQAAETGVVDDETGGDEFEGPAAAPEVTDELTPVVDETDEGDAEPTEPEMSASELDTVVLPLQPDTQLPTEAPGQPDAHLELVPESTHPEPAPEPEPIEAAKPLTGSTVDHPLPRVMAIANQKGGVGKTTTAVNLGAALAELGYRVLVVDLDPQGNATTGLGINSRNLDVSLYDVIMHDVPLEDCVEPTSVRNLFVAPATIDLAGAEIELVPAFSRELKLKRALERGAADFDFTLIDCPPSLGLLTVNGLAAATEVVVPIQCEYYALEGLGQLLRNVALVKGNLNPTLDMSTIILTMYDARTKLAEQVANEVRQHFGTKVCRNIVPRTVRLSEAPSFGQPIIVFDPSSRGAIAYRELAKEVSGGAPQRVG